jgi:hypothetical protein
MIRTCAGLELARVSKVLSFPSFLAARTLTVIADGGLLGWTTLGVNTVNNNVPQPPNQKRHVVDWHLD